MVIVELKHIENDTSGVPIPNAKNRCSSNKVSSCDASPVAANTATSGDSTAEELTANESDGPFITATNNVWNSHSRGRFFKQCNLRTSRFGRCCKQQVKRFTPTVSQWKTSSKAIVAERR